MVLRLFPKTEYFPLAVDYAASMAVNVVSTGIIFNLLQYFVDHCNVGLARVLSSRTRRGKDLRICQHLGTQVLYSFKVAEAY